MPVLQHEVRDGAVLVARVDAAYPDFQIALEYDSYEHHTGRAAAVRDSARRNRLARHRMDRRLGDRGGPSNRRVHRGDHDPRPRACRVATTF